MYTDAPQFARAPRVQFVAARGCEPFLHGSHSGTSAMSPKNATVSERRQAILEPPAVKGRGCVCVYIRLRRSKYFQVFAFPGKRGRQLPLLPPTPLATPLMLVIFSRLTCNNIIMPAYSAQGYPWVNYPYPPDIALWGERSSVRAKTIATKDHAALSVSMRELTFSCRDAASPSTQSCNRGVLKITNSGLHRAWSVVTRPLAYTLPSPSLSRATEGYLCLTGGRQLAVRYYGNDQL